MKEIWKPIKGYKGYEISNHGRVKSYHKTKNGRILKGSINAYGYVDVKLKRENNRQDTIKIHRLVALHFIPNIENKPEVNHIDGNKSNNKYDNLEWCNRSENIQHAYNNKLCENQRNKLIKYNLIQKSKSVILLNTGEIFQSARIAVEKLNLNCGKEAIQNCCKGKSKTSEKINGEPSRWLYVKDFLKRCQYTKL